MTARLADGSLRVPVTPDGLFIFDPLERVYLARRRSTSGWHIVRPLTADDPGVAEGSVRAGDLTCCCPGGIYRGACYRIAEARAFEAAGSLDLDEVESWFGEPVPVATA